MLFLNIANTLGDFMQPYLEIVEMPGSSPIKAYNASTLHNQIQVHPHWHKEIEILYILDGQAKQQVANYLFDVNKGDIVIIGSNQLHSTYSYKGKGCEIFVLLLDITSFITQNMSAKERDMLNDFSSGLRFFSAEGRDCDAVRKMHEPLLAIRREYKNNGFAHELIIRSCIYEFAAKVLKNCKQLIKEQRYLMNERNTLNVLKNTFKFIDENYTDNIPLSKAAAVSNLSVTHFCRLFKNATGMTYNEYLNFYRVNRAEKMLFSSNSMIEIALNCGFGSVSSFIRNFKKYKNCTPSLYKKSQELPGR